MRMMLRGAMCLWLGVACGSAPAGPGLSIVHTGTMTVPTTTTDQNGQPFTIAEMSGVTQLADGRWCAVLDSGGKLVFMDIAFAPDGSMSSLAVTGGLSLAQTRDFEGITPGSATSVWLSEENGPGIREYSLVTGEQLTTLSVPTVFAMRRANRGFESLTRSPGATTLWTGNEEALRPDGPVSSPTQATRVRLLRYDMLEGSFESVVQHAYDVEPMHGPFVPISEDGRSGLSDLLLLPSGRLLALERSLAFANPALLTRIYEVGTGGADDVSDQAGLDGVMVTPVAKTLIYSGGHSNMEGLGLGPVVAPGSRVLIGVVDDGDPLSSNDVVSFVISGDVECGADLAAPFGSLDVFDLIAFLALFDAEDPGADLVAPFGLWDFFDVLEYLGVFDAGCP